MRQLALDIRLAEHAVFASFHPGPNSLAVSALERMAAGDGASALWVWGAPGMGKSHLLQAGVAAAHERGQRTAYLPLATLSRIDPGVLDGLGACDLVALDDVGVVAGNVAWERALLRLYEALVPAGRRLLGAGEAPPARLGLALGDLASRLAAGGVFRLEPLAEADCLEALRRRAEWLGCALPEETGRYLLARVDRSVSALCTLLDRLDRAALVAQKRLTIPFVRSVLEAWST